MKKITTKQLLKLMDDYLRDECRGLPEKIRLSDFTLYINSKGIRYSYESVRKNKDLVEYVRKLKDTGIDEDYRVLATYTTLDVGAFIAKNNTPEKLTKALAQLDGYYAEVAKSGLKFHEDWEKSNTKANKLNKECSELKQKLEKKTTLADECKDKLKEKDDIIKYLKKYIDEYVYEGCAEAVLKERGIVTEDKGLDEKIIKEDDIISRMMEGFD